MSTKRIAIAFSLAAHLSSAFQPRVLSSFAAASVTRRSSSSSISMDSGLTLYGSQQTRSPLVNWYLEEKSIPFTQKAPRPSAHPFGQTPFLTDDGGVEVFESGAILLYIADAYGGKRISKKHHRLLSIAFRWCSSFRSYKRLKTQYFANHVMKTTKCITQSTTQSTVPLSLTAHQYVSGRRTLCPHTPKFALIIL